MKIGRYIKHPYLYAALHYKEPINNQKEFQVSYTGYRRVTIPNFIPELIQNGSAFIQAAAFPRNKSDETVSFIGVSIATKSGKILIWNVLNQINGTPLEISLDKGESIKVSFGDINLNEFNS